MGFAKVWSNRQALDIKSSEMISLPFPVRAVLLDTESKFYAIPVELPRGLDEVDGQLVVCESHDGGVAIKAWRFNDGDWNEAKLGGGIHVDEFAKLIKIVEQTDGYDHYYNVWYPADKEAWRNPGSIGRHDQYGCFETYEDRSFQEFMDKEFPYPQMGE